MKMIDIETKINGLLSRNPDPREGVEGKADFRQLHFLNICPPMLGIVVDTHDPEGLGRIRVSHEGTMPGSVSPWLPVAGHSRGNGRGFWTLPSTGTQALVAYTSGDRRSGYVLGFIYDGQHKPPEATSGKASDSILVQTKNHRIEITDSEGSGEVRIESAEGQMRAVIGSEGGITLVNELGGIGIRCRRLAMDCGGETFLKSRSISIETEDNSEVSAGGKSTMEADGDATLKGKNIRLSGSKGVCAEGKQIAVQDDRVMGFDTHMMVVPSGSGTATVPLPHPFMGKMSGDLSEDVKIGGKECAVKGSKAKHNDSSHMQLPGTIRFQKKPKCEGEVTGGTSAKVKIDGKEAAVIGSQVTTCNDMGARNNSTIMAVGSAMPMPAIINPQNAEEYRREREEQEKKEPAFQSVRWSKTCVEEGEEVELSAGVKDIADGNMVTLQVFHEGQGPGDGRALATMPLTVKDGAVSARWSWKSDAREMRPETDPKFIFTAHSAWCNFEKSSNSLEVKVKRPEITKVEWQDSDGNVVQKSKVDDFVTLYAETKDVEDGKTVIFKIFEENQDINNDSPIKMFDATVENNEAKADYDFCDLIPPPKIDEALYRYYKNQGYDIPREEFEFMLEDYGEEIESPYKAKPKFKIVAECIRCEEKVSEKLELSKDIEVTRLDSSNNPIEDVKVYLKEPDGKEHKVTTDENGVARFEDLIPGIYHIRIEETEKNENDGSGGASAAGSNDKSSSSANEPEKKILNPQWKNSDGETINKALVGDEVILCADVTDIDDGKSATIKIVEKDDDGNDDDVATISGTVKSGKIECKWKVIYTADEDDSNSQKEKEEKGYTLPEYAFIVECEGVESEESGQLDVTGWIKVQYVDKSGKPLANKKYYIYWLDEKTCISGTTDEYGFAKEENLRKGRYFIIFED